MQVLSRGLPQVSACGSNSGKGWDRALLQWDTGNAWASILSHHIPSNTLAPRDQSM